MKISKQNKKILNLGVASVVSAILLLNSFVNVGSAAPVEQWNKLYGNGIISYVEQTKDGGYVFTSGGGLVIKTSADGTEQWRKSLDLPGSSSYVGQTTDGGYLEVSGNTTVKLDNNGNIQWSKIYNYPGLIHSALSAGQQTSDGGYILAGTIGSPDGYAWLIKTDSNGVQQWDSILGDSPWTNANSVQQTTDGGYVLAGIDNTYAWVSKTNSKGQNLWYVIIKDWPESRFKSIKQTSDGGYIVAGEAADSNCAGDNFDILLVKIGSNGQVQWKKTYGLSQCEDFGNSVSITSDGGYLIAGQTSITPNSGAWTAWALKTDSNGIEQWSKTIKGFGDYGSMFSSGHQTSDGGYILAGGTDALSNSEQLWLVKLTDSISTPQKVFVTGSDNALYYKQFDGTAWGNWQNLGGTVLSNPEAAVLGVNLGSTTYVFVSGSDHAVWYKSNSGTTWSNWNSLGGYTLNDPEAIILGTNLFIFVRGQDNSVWYKKYDGTTWSNWLNLGGSIISNLTAISWPSGLNTIYLFGIGVDKGIWYKKFDGTAWSNWNSLGGYATSDSEVTSLGGILYLFLNGKDNSEWYRSFDGTAWSNWQSVGGSAFSNPNVPDCSDCGATNLQLFVKGGDNALWYKTNDETTWSNWNSLGGFIVGNPESNPETSTTLTERYIYVRGSNNALFYNKYDGTSWSGWQTLGGIIKSDADVVNS